MEVLNIENLESKIIILRNEKVLPSSDVAEYGLSYPVMKKIQNANELDLEKMN